MISDKLLEQIGESAKDFIPEISWRVSPETGH
jgi:hypothetical protein